MKNYRLKFQIVEEGCNHPIESDWVTISSIDQFGGCESVDHGVAKMLRYWNEKGRAEYEREVYGDDQNLDVDELAATMRMIGMRAAVIDERNDDAT